MCDPTVRLCAWRGGAKNRAEGVRGEGDSRLKLKSGRKEKEAGQPRASCVCTTGHMPRTTDISHCTTDIPQPPCANRHPTQLSTAEDRAVLVGSDTAQSYIVQLQRTPPDQRKHIKMVLVYDGGGLSYGVRVWLWVRPVTS